MHVKGQELPMHEPRGKVSLGLAYAISPTGADHMEARPRPLLRGLGDFDSGLAALGLIEPSSRLDMSPAKVRAFFYRADRVVPLQQRGHVRFRRHADQRAQARHAADYVNAATGWNMSLWELMKVGERANTMARLFNNRCGFTAADDTLPDRLFEGLGNGHLQGRGIDRAEFAQMVKTYYQMAGWDENGVPDAGEAGGAGALA